MRKFIKISSASLFPVVHLWGNVKNVTFVQ